MPQKYDQLSVGVSGGVCTSGVRAPYVSRFGLSQFSCVSVQPITVYVVSQSQAVTVLTALTLARDEVHWLYKHSTVTAPKGSRGRPNPDDYSDHALPELIFHIVQLKGEPPRFIVVPIPTQCCGTNKII